MLPTVYSRVPLVQAQRCLCMRAWPCAVMVYSAAMHVSPTARCPPTRLIWHAAPPACHLSVLPKDTYLSTYIPTQSIHRSQLRLGCLTSFDIPFTYAAFTRLPARLAAAKLWRHAAQLLVLGRGRHAGVRQELRAPQPCCEQGLRRGHGGGAGACSTHAA